MNNPGDLPASQAEGYKDEWLTPPGILEALGPFDLDPCAPVVRPWPMADRHFTVEENGLLQPWEGRVWLNPPYGKETWKWLNKMALHGDGIALIFARTETEGFFRFVWGFADALLFIRGRLRFHHVNGERSNNAGAPSVLAAYGKESTAVLEHSGLSGKFISLKGDRG